VRLRLGPASISIERGDITDWEVDAIVNAANTTLVMGTGVAGAIKRKGGVIIEEEALRQGPVEVGEAVLTTGGNLAATHVIHGAVMGTDLKTDGEAITKTTRAVLTLADKHRLTSVALPALGTGVGHVPPPVSADAMLNEVVTHLKRGQSSLRRVVFVLYLDEAYRAFSDTLKRLGGMKKTRACPTSSSVNRSAGAWATCSWPRG
jgi:O-acetyl-ADP-ribose deacetylase (regulator of RNase III)